MSFEKILQCEPFVNAKPPKYLLPLSVYHDGHHRPHEDHIYTTKLLVETVLKLQQRLEIHIGENLRLNEIVAKLNVRLEKLERSNLELKINSFHQSLNEYDEVIGRLHGLLKKYEEENESLKAINRIELLKEEIQCKQDELAILETEIEGQSIV